MKGQLQKSKKGNGLAYTNRLVRDLYPYKIILLLVLLGVSSLFAGFCVAFALSARPDWLNIKPPLAFVVSSAVVVVSSSSLVLARFAFGNDLGKLFRYCLTTAMIMGVVFLASQAAGWFQLRQALPAEGSRISVSWLYLLSGLHLIHVVGGVVFMTVFTIGSLRKTGHPATALVYFTNPVKKLLLELLSIYWHFLGAVWLLVLLFFLVVGTLVS